MQTNETRIMTDVDFEIRRYAPAMGAEPTRITVADFEDGRVQTFDSSGTPLGSFNLSADGQKVYVTSLAVDRDGQIYVPYNFAIHIYDPDGTETGTLGGLDQRYGFVTVGGDGKLYGIADQESIVRFGADFWNNPFLYMALLAGSLSR